MPTFKRFKTNYPGVFFIEGTSPATGKPEKIFYIRYRKGGKMIEEKAGRQFQDDMTPARAGTLKDLWEKVKTIAHGPHAGLLERLIDLLYERERRT